MKFIFLNRINQYLLIPLVLILLMPGFSKAMSISPLNDRILVQRVTDDGSEDLIEVYGFSHEIVSPRDASSGLPTGKRQHKPVNITKEIDKSSPLWSSGLVDGDTFSVVILTTRKDAEDGSRRVIKTIKLNGASVCGVSNTLSPDHKRETELISFCYESISWTWHTKDGDKVITDTWEQPKD